MERGITFGDRELQQLFDSLKFEDNDTPYVSHLERYANGHLLDVSDPSNELNKRIALGCGVGLTEQDMGHFVRFSDRVNRLTERANEVNCALLIDAEQTYMQAAIDSFAQQLAHKYNRGTKHIVLNTYQCYLKKQPMIIDLELQAVQKLGCNLGIKLVRGCYMVEERKIATELGYESPVWETIEDTHKSYNSCAEKIIDQVGEHGLLFLGSHNAQTLSLVKDLVNKKGQAFKDQHRVKVGQLKGFSD